MSEDKGNAEDVKKIYSMVDRLSYLDWGLRSEDEVGLASRLLAPPPRPASVPSVELRTLLPLHAQVSGKRERCQVSANLDTFDGCIVHDGAIWGEAAHGRGNGGRGAKTARTSEGYGEATQATAERLIQILSKLTHFVPAMGGWDGLWNLDADACFLDIGSGYGKVVIHAKLHTGCRSAVGVECVAKRVEISTLALQGLYGELDRGRLANDLLKGQLAACPCHSPPSRRPTATAHICSSHAQASPSRPSMRRLFSSLPTHTSTSSIASSPRS